jgi:hypothetical protein
VTVAKGSVARSDRALARIKDKSQKSKVESRESRVASQESRVKSRAGVHLPLRPESFSGLFADLSAAFQMLKSSHHEAPTRIARFCFQTILTGRVDARASKASARSTRCSAL